MLNFLQKISITLMVYTTVIWDYVSVAPLMVLFGVYGTDTVSAGGHSGGTFLSRITYNMWHRIMVVDIQKGKTTFRYTVIGVRPGAYRKLRANPSAEAFNTEFRKSGNYTIETIWRYSQGGTYRNDGRRARKLRKAS